MFQPSSTAHKVLINTIHNAERLERVNNAIELIEASRRNDMSDEELVKMTLNYCNNKTQANIINHIVEYEKAFNYLTKESD